MLGPGDLVPMRDVVTGATMLPGDRPVVFKSVGMSWEDLVVARAVMTGHARPRRHVTASGPPTGGIMGRSSLPVGHIEHTCRPLEHEGVRRR